MNRRIVFFNLAVLAAMLPCLSLTLVPGPVQVDKRLVDLEKTVAELQDRVKKIEGDLATLNGLGKALVDGARALDQATEQSRKDGFEYAGANPQSKTDILNGLKNFAAAIQKATKVEKKQETPRKRRGIW